MRKAFSHLIWKVVSLDLALLERWIASQYAI